MALNRPLDGPAAAEIAEIFTEVVIAPGADEAARAVFAEQTLSNAAGFGPLSGAPLLRFFRFGAAGGEAPASRILARDTLAAPAEVARMLGCGPGEQALRLKRLRSVGSHPALHEEIWLPLPLFSALAEGNLTGWGDLLYPLFAERCGVHVQRAVDTIGFGNLSAAHARALRLPAGHPCARVQRQAFDLSGRCVEWRTTLGDANAFHYTVSIT